MQLNAIQHQFRDALKASMKIQEASQQAMLERFHKMDGGASEGPTHAEELAAGLKQLLLDEDSEDHKLLVQVGFVLLRRIYISPTFCLQYLKATSKNPCPDLSAKKSTRTSMIVVESSDLKRLTETCRVLAVDLNHMQDQEDYLYQRVQELETNTSITALKLRSNDINVAGSQALTSMFEPLVSTAMSHRPSFDFHVLIFFSFCGIQVAKKLESVAF
jgi:hypothetical protein